MDKITTEEIEKVRDEARGVLAKSAYVYLIGIVTVILAAGSSLLGTVLLTQRSEHKLCAIVILSDDAYHRTPPTSDLGKEQARNFSDLRRSLGCKPYKGV